MATKKALVIYDGKVGQLRTGDTVEGAGGVSIAASVTTATSSWTRFLADVTATNVQAALNEVDDIAIEVVNSSVEPTTTYSGMIWIDESTDASIVMSNYVLHTYLTASLADYAKTATLANYALTSTLANYPTRTELTATLTDYATVATLGNYALTATLGNYALTATLTNYVLDTDLTASLAEYAKTATLANYPTRTELTATLTDYATNATLGNYALTATLNNYALTATLANYVDRTELAATLADYATNATLGNYALTATLNNYALTATLNNYALTATLANYVLDTDLTASLAEYAKTATLTNYPTRTELTATLADYATNATLGNYALTATLNNYALTATLTNYVLDADMTASLAEYAKLDSSNQPFTGSVIAQGNASIDGLVSIGSSLAVATTGISRTIQAHHPTQNTIIHMSSGDPGVNMLMSDSDSVGNSYIEVRGDAFNLYAGGTSIFTGAASTLTASGTFVGRGAIVGRSTASIDGNASIGGNAIIAGGNVAIKGAAGGELLTIIDTGGTSKEDANPYLYFKYGATATTLGYIGYGSTGNDDLYIYNQRGETYLYSTAVRTANVNTSGFEVIAGDLIASNDLRVKVNASIDGIVYIGDKLAIQNNNASYVVDIRDSTALTMNLQVTASNAYARYMLRGDAGNSNYADFIKYGGNAGGTLFDTALANHTLIYSGGANNSGLTIGAHTAAPLNFGTNNTKRGYFAAGGQFVTISPASLNATLNVGGPHIVIDPDNAEALTVSMNKSLRVFAGAGEAAGISLRQTNDNVEMINYCWSGGGIVGNVTDHTFYIRQNNLNRVVIEAGGVVTIASGLTVTDNASITGHLSGVTASFSGSIAPFNLTLASPTSAEDGKSIVYNNTLGSLGWGEAGGGVSVAASVTTATWGRFLDDVAATNVQSALDTIDDYAVEVVQGTSEPATTYAGMIWVDTDAAGQTWSTTPKGYANRSQFVYVSAASLALGGGVYHHDGSNGDLLLANTATITISVTSNTGWNYIYIDDSTLSAGDTTITSANILASTTAPTYSLTKTGWYNGNDRCIFGTYCTAGSTQAEFYHMGNYVTLADRITNATFVTTLDTTWTDVTLTAPLFGAPIDTAMDYDPANETKYNLSFYWRTNGQTGSTGKAVIRIEQGVAAYLSGHAANFITIPDSSGIIECRGDIANGATVYVYTHGWYFPVGM